MKEKFPIRFFGSLLGFCGNLWSCISWLYQGGWSKEELLFGPPEYIVVIVFCTGFIVYLNWGWISGYIPYFRFGKLENQIHELINFHGTAYVHGAKRIVLEMELSSLKIPRPHIDDATGWQWYLPRLYSLCKDRKLKKARELWQ